jgi:hypothetical protein
MKQARQIAFNNDGTPNTDFAVRATLKRSMSSLSLADPGPLVIVAPDGQEDVIRSGVEALYGHLGEAFQAAIVPAAQYTAYRKAVQEATAAKLAAAQSRSIITTSREAFISRDQLKTFLSPSARLIASYFFESWSGMINGMGMAYSMWPMLKRTLRGEKPDFAAMQKGNHRFFHPLVRAGLVLTLGGLFLTAAAPMASIWCGLTAAFYGATSLAGLAALGGEALGLLGVLSVAFGNATAIVTLSDGGLGAINYLRKNRIDSGAVDQTPFAAPSVFDHSRASRVMALIASLTLASGIGYGMPSGKFEAITHGVMGGEPTVILAVIASFGGLFLLNRYTKKTYSQTLPQFLWAA